MCSQDNLESRSYKDQCYREEKNRNYHFPVSDSSTHKDLLNKLRRVRKFDEETKPGSCIPNDVDDPQADVPTGTSFLELLSFVANSQSS